MRGRLFGRGRRPWRDAPWGDERGAVAVEFAFVMPMLLALYLGGFAASQAVATWRKMSDATSQITSVTTQFTSMKQADVLGVETAAAQIMSPYNTSALSVLITRVDVDASGNAAVFWSQPNANATSIPTGTKVTLPANLTQPGTSVIWVQTSYPYTPAAGAAYVPKMTLTDQLYSAPRSSTNIPCPDCL